MYRLTDKGQNELAKLLKSSSQEELASRSGVCRQTFRKIIQGEPVFESKLRQVTGSLNIPFLAERVTNKVRHDEVINDNFYQITSQIRKIEAQLRKVKSMLQGTMSTQSMIKVFDFIADMTAQGKVVNVTDHYSSTHVLTNDNLTAERAVWTPAQFNLSRICYEPMWRDAGSGDRLDYLIEELPKVGEGNSIPEYNYDLLRVPRESFTQGDLCRYFPTVYYFSDFIGNRPVRISVSNPGDYEVIRLADN